MADHQPLTQHKNMPKDISKKGPIEHSKKTADKQPDTQTLPRTANDACFVLPADVISLQRTVGNRAVAQMLQPKQTSPATAARGEQEAERVAESSSKRKLTARGQAAVAYTAPKPMVQRRIGTSTADEDLEVKTDKELKEIVALLKSKDRQKTSPQEKWDYYEKLLKACDLFVEKYKSTTGGPSTSVLEVSATARETVAQDLIDKVRELKRAAYSEQLEQEFQLDFNTQTSHTYLEKISRGETLRKDKPAALSSETSSETRHSVEKAREEIGASSATRIRQLHAILTSLDIGQDDPQVFEKVQSLMAGGVGLKTGYDEYADRFDDPYLKRTLEVQITDRFKDENQQNYLKRLAQTGQIDAGMEVVHNLGVTGGRKARGEFIPEAIEGFFASAEIITSQEAGETAVKAQTHQLDKKFQEFTNQLFAGFQVTGEDIKAPGSVPNWKSLAPWSKLGSTSLARIEAAVAYFSAIKETADTKAADPTAALGAAEKKKFIDASIEQLKTIVWSLTGYISISDEEKERMFDKVKDWKKQSTTLEKKFGLTANEIGFAATQPTSPLMNQLQKAGGTAEKIGFLHSDKNYLLDIVRGTVGVDVKSTITYSRELASTGTVTDDEGVLSIEQIIRHATTTRKVSKDSEKVGDDIAEAAKANPDALLNYLLKHGPGGSIDQAAWSGKSPTEKETFIKGALDILRTEIASLTSVGIEKIIGVFKFGGDVTSEGEGYIRIREIALSSNWRYNLKRHNINQESQKLTDRDRAYIRADSELMAKIAELYTDEKNEKQRLEARFGFALAPLTGVTFVGGKDVMGANEGIEKIENMNLAAGSKDDLIKHWIKLFRNAYSKLSTERTNKTKVREVAYNAQAAIKTWADDANNIRREGKAADAIYTEIVGAVKAGVTDKNHLIEYVGEPWFTGYHPIDISTRTEAAMGTVAIDDEAFIKAVEDAEGAELLRTFSDIERFGDLCAAFQNQIDQINNMAGDTTKEKERRDRIDFATELQHRIINYTPGVKLSLVTRLESLKRVRAEERRNIVASIQGKLSEAFSEDTEAQAKIQEVRATLAGTVNDTTDGTKSTEAETLAADTKRGLTRQLLPEEFSAMSENVEQERHMATTKARRGVELRALSGNYSAMEQARAEYLGSSRAISEQRTQISKQQQVSPQQESVWRLELADKLKKVSETKQKYEVATERFLTFREKVKNYIQLAISLIITIVVSAATAGAGLAALPIYIQLAITAAMSILNQSIDAAFDPEQVTVGDAVFKVLSDVAIQASSWALGNYLNQVIHFNFGPGNDMKIWGPEATLENKTELTKIEWIDARLRDGYKSFFDSSIKSFQTSIVESIKEQVQTGKGGEKLKGDFADFWKSQVESFVQSFVAGTITDAMGFDDLNREEVKDASELKKLDYRMHHDYREGMRQWAFGSALGNALSVFSTLAKDRFRGQQRLGPGGVTPELSLQGVDQEDPAEKSSGAEIDYDQQLDTAKSGLLTGMEEMITGAEAAKNAMTGPDAENIVMEMEKILPLKQQLAVLLLLKPNISSVSPTAWALVEEKKPTVEAAFAAAILAGKTALEAQADTMKGQVSTLKGEADAAYAQHSVGRARRRLKAAQTVQAGFADANHFDTARLGRIATIDQPTADSIIAIKTELDKMITQVDDMINKPSTKKSKGSSQKN